jgi:hypothetical protein
MHGMHIGLFVFLATGFSLGILGMGFATLIFGVFLKGKAMPPEDDTARRGRELRLPMKKWQRAI